MTGKNNRSLEWILTFYGFLHLTVLLAMSLVQDIKSLFHILGTK
jgi:hypothetical protein